MEPGSGFNPERGRSPFVDGPEWHFKQGYLDRSANMMHSRMYMEKREPSSSELKGMPPCSCHGCSMSRHHESLWMQQEQWCYRSKEFVAKPPVFEGSSGMQSPCFSVRTPVRRDSGERSSFCYMGPSLGVSPLRPRFQTSENQMTLHKWFLIPVKESDHISGGPTVALGGFVRYGFDVDMEYRRTSPVIERTDKGRLKTSDGVDIRLVGCIDEDATATNGFTAELAQYFFTGFPATWKKLIAEDRTRKLENERLASVQGDLHVDKTSSPDCVAGTNNSVDQFVTPQVTADSTLCGDDAPLREPVCPEIRKPSTSGDQKVVDEEDEVARRPPDHNENEKQDGNVPDDTARVVAGRRRSSIPTRSSKRLKDRGRGQESDAGTRNGRDKEELCCDDKVSAMVPVDENGTVEHEPKTDSLRELGDTGKQRPAKRADKKKSNSAQKNSEEESDGSNEPRGRVFVDKEPDVAQVDVPAAETVQERPVELVAETVAPPVTDAVPHDVVEAAEDLSVLEPAADVPETPEVNQQQKTSVRTGRKRSRGRPAPRTSKKRKTTAKKTVEVVHEAVESKGQGEVEVISATDSNPPDARLNDNVDTGKPTSKRQLRKRGVSKMDLQPTCVPVIEVIDIADADDEVPKAGDVPADVESKLPEDIKPKSKRPPSRTKRSTLPPPLPASRVEKSEVIEAFGLKTSRSGRLLVPPLAFWRNQTLARDKDGGIIAIMDGFKEPPSDTGYYNFKPPTEKRRLQEKLCATAVESPKRALVIDKGKKKVRGSK